MIKMNAAGRDRQNPEILIATLGVEPQVVTITLDRLLAGGRAVSEVAVVYTENPVVQKAMDMVAGEFRSRFYPGIQLRPVPVTAGQEKIRDFCNNADLQALLRTLYGEVRRARQQGFIVHLCVSGGRKVMGIMAMVVAQLLFGPEDCAWHLVTEGWQPGDRRRLHLPAGEKVWLVPVPVLRWQEAGTLVRAVTELDDPAEVVAWYEKLTRDERAKRKGEFIRHWLTPAERQVVELACRGLDNKAIAARLYKKEQTVANQLRSVYEKLREWLGYPAGTIERSVLIAEFSSYFLSETFSSSVGTSRV
ncbi:CRISPR-associated protein Csx14 [Moorella sp. Hama-1]|uniref:CRISPR-associated protein Csx14 n=2 Tax=Moorella sp. Hama-1 TaxID=2138101 RepID=UPI000D650FEA|nr:CRISPR-associated protein Csx14 [Moorella sp. Hama-1]